VAGLGLLLGVLWRCSPVHRRTFRALNAYLRQSPDTQFIFLSPFPHLDPTVNSLRRLGGWLLRRGLTQIPNCHWLDTHQLLPLEPALFADSGHLSERGHHLLAQSLAATYFQEALVLQQA
jgi:hypothetical protein